MINTTAMRRKPKSTPPVIPANFKTSVVVEPPETPPALGAAKNKKSVSNYSLSIPTQVHQKSAMLPGKQTQL